MSKTVRARLIKLQSMQTKRILNNYHVVFVANMVDGTLVYSRNGEPVGISKVLAKSLGTVHTKWSVVCYALMRDHNGREYLKSFVVTTPSPCRHEQIREQVADLHWDYLDKNCNANHFLTAASIASAIDNQPSDEVADKIFTHIGAWQEFIAEHEDNKNQTIN
ncbi:hypothetical protein [Vibrio anguillarum]|uniref:hypothetical protein n=1 Tax=Vibrio anguillarum TaxID=55601 RepID=UPI000BB44810|nr:hypothetical protein [Vibrio anguillarum]AVT67777.1 hypothetical protein B5S57_11480 [Vibrio anguillarum]